MPDSTTLLIRIRYETNHYCFIAEMQAGQKRFATITAYDYSFAKLFADEGLNVMLVGDSLGMTVQGHDSTLPVTVADIAYHTAAVRRGAPNCLLLADLPFMAYATPETKPLKTPQWLCVLGPTWSKLKAVSGW